MGKSWTVNLRDLFKEDRSRGAGAVALSILFGLLLSRFFMQSPSYGIVAAAVSCILALTILLRKAAYLVFVWFVLTSVLNLLIHRFWPGAQSHLFGQSIFWGILACVIAAWGIEGVLQRRRFSAFSDVGLTCIVVVFLFWCLISIATSIDIGRSAKQWVHLIIALTVFYMFYDFFSVNRENIDKVLRALFGVTAAISVLACAMALDGLIRGIPIYKRIALWFWNTNSLGYFLFVAIPIIATSDLPLFRFKWAKRAVFGLFLGALWVSFSRASWLGAATSTAFLVWQGRWRIPMSVILVSGIVIYTFSAVFFGYDLLLGERFSGRTELWAAAWSVASERPLLGVGLGNCAKAMYAFIETPWLRNQGPHSMYLNNAGEIGFVSVFFWGAFLARYLYSTGKIERHVQSDKLRRLVRGARATIVGLAFHGIFENGSLLTSFMAAEFTVILPYILLAIPFSAQRLEEKMQNVR